MYGHAVIEDNRLDSLAEYFKLQPHLALVLTIIIVIIILKTGSEPEIG